MARSGQPNTRGRKTARPTLAPRETFEQALASIATLGPKAKPQSHAAEYLPKFISKLRELGYTQDDIVVTIGKLNLGVTERQIRQADRAHTKASSKAAPPSPGGDKPPAPGQPGGGAPPGDSQPPKSATQHPHAGLTGPGVLRRG